MASEIEEPFRLSFQSDSIHSGSISFGRFETEALSWERWSSFSHNRHLEEVEKYSRPGSVTEKKAYFEAHFKRRALLNRCSSNCQSGTEYQSSENDLSEKTVYSEELEQSSEGNHSVQLDKSFIGSEYGGEIEVTNHERLDTRSSYVETQLKPTTDTFRPNVHSSSESVKEIHSSSIIDEQRREVNKNRKDEAAMVDSTLKSVDSCTNSCTTTGDVSASTVEDDTGSSEPQQVSSPQVEIKLKSKPGMPKSKSLLSVSQFQSTSSGRQSKEAAEKHNKTKREGSRTTTNTRLLSQKAATVPNPVHRISKPEESKSSKLKLVDVKRRNESKTEKVVRTKPSAMQKGVPETRRTTSKAMLNENSIKPGTRNSSVLSRSKNDERPERIKEEKREAEVKQHRKSPNLKATPKPSFYLETVVRGSGKNKVVSSSDRPSKTENKLAPKIAATVKPRSDTKAKNGTATSGSRSAVPGIGLQQHRLTGSIHIEKSPNNEESQKMDVRRSRVEILRKDIRGRCMVGVSRTGRAVGVAS